MSLLYQDNYKKCEKCGNKAFTSQPIVHILDGKKEDSDYELLTCVSCGLQTKERANLWGRL